MAGESIARVLGAVGLVVLAGCSPIHIGSRTIDFGFGGSGAPAPSDTAVAPLTPSGASEQFGSGPIQVSLLLPLTGDPSLASVGQSMANGSRLAMAFIEANPNIAENTTITLRDTGGTVAGATAATSAAIAAGAKLILGPLRGDSVTAGGAVARSAGIPLIGFSNNPGAAVPGVYLLSVLPDMEMKRAFDAVKSAGRRGVAGAFASSAYGQAQQAAFRQQAALAGFAPSAVYTFTGPAEAAQIVAQAQPLIEMNQIDTLFLPDRASAPAFAAALAQAGVSPTDVQIVGSADWEGDTTILATPALAGAIYPAVDPAGLAAIRADYQARFGGTPHALATIAYTATILANVNTLSMASPPYNPALLTNPTGFNGRDGVFRFRSDGRSEYALAILQVGPGGAVRLEGPKL